MQHLPPYHMYSKGLDWGKHWTHCRTADIDDLFPEMPVTPTSPASMAKMKRAKHSDWDGAEQRKVDKLLLGKK